MNIRIIFLLVFAISRAQAALVIQEDFTDGRWDHPAWSKVKDASLEMKGRGLSRPLLGPRGVVPVVATIDVPFIQIGRDEVLVMSLDAFSDAAMANPSLATVELACTHRMNADSSIRVQRIFSASRRSVQARVQIGTHPAQSTGLLFQKGSETAETLAMTTRLTAVFSRRLKGTHVELLAPYGNVMVNSDADLPTCDQITIAFSSIPKEEVKDVSYVSRPGTTLEKARIGLASFAVRTTWIGDLNLDGTVDEQDEKIFEANKGKKKPSRGDGDVNHDGTIDDSDQNLIRGQKLKKK